MLYINFNLVILVFSFFNFNLINSMSSELTLHTKRSLENYSLSKIEKKQKKNLTIISCRNENSSLPIFISYELAQFSPTLADMLKNAMELDNTEIIDFSDTFSQFNSIYREVDFVITLLEKLQKKHTDNPALYTLLISNELHEKEQFCWENINLLRH